MNRAEHEPCDPAVADTCKLCLGLLAGTWLLAMLLLVCFALWKRLPLP